MKRKTYTSSAVKNRWNAQHYDRVTVNVPAGGREELQELAELAGQTVSAYIRTLVIRDATKRGVALPQIGGGGLIESWEQKAQRARERLLEGAF